MSHVTPAVCSSSVRLFFPLLFLWPCTTTSQLCVQLCSGVPPCYSVHCPGLFFWPCPTSSQLSAALQWGYSLLLCSGMFWPCPTSSQLSAALQWGVSLLFCSAGRVPLYPSCLQLFSGVSPCSSVLLAVSHVIPTVCSPPVGSSLLFCSWVFFWPCPTSSQLSAALQWGFSLLLCSSGRVPRHPSCLQLFSGVSPCSFFLLAVSHVNPAVCSSPVGFLLAPLFFWPCPTSARLCAALQWDAFLLACTLSWTVLLAVTYVIAAHPSAGLPQSSFALLFLVVPSVCNSKCM